MTTKENAGASAQTILSNVSYLAFGPLGGATFGNGLVLSRTYDADFFLDNIDLRPAGGSPIMSRAHAFTDNLNLTGLNDNAIAPSESQTFDYDFAQRLKTAVGIYGSRAYAYDLVGNRASETITPSGGSAVTQTYAYPSTSNKLSTVIQGATTLRSFTHDAAGNITGDARSGVAWSHTINKAGRIARIDEAALQKGAYLYDGRSRLSSRVTTNITPAGTTHLVHDLNNRVIAETDGSGAAGTTREYIWLDDMPIAVVDRSVSPATIAMVHADHLNRPILMTDASQAIVWKALYEPFGQVHSIAGPASLDMRFPGQWFQIENGLTYNWHRTYDASVGRYTQPDPLGYEALRSDGPSAYGYAAQSPIANVDPEGKFWQQILFWGAVGVITDLSEQLFVERRTLTGVDGWRLLCSGLKGAAFGLVGANTLGRLKEISIRGVRLAPFGNWTRNANNPISKWPHYHRRIPDPKNPGHSLPGQGVGNHRPWEGGW